MIDEAHIRVFKGDMPLTARRLVGIDPEQGAPEAGGGPWRNILLVRIDAGQIILQHCDHRALRSLLWRGIMKHDNSNPLSAGPQ